MKAAQIRERVLNKVRQAASQGDEEATARVMGYARAVLVAVAQHSDDAEVNLENLSLTTATAARILDLHPEYVRHLIRQESIKAEKENGEYRIAFPDLVTFMVGFKRVGPAGFLPTSPSLSEWLRHALSEERAFRLWPRSSGGPQAGGQPA